MKYIGSVESHSRMPAGITQPDSKLVFTVSGNGLLTECNQTLDLSKARYKASKSPSGFEKYCVLIAQGLPHPNSTARLQASFYCFPKQTLNRMQPNTRLE